MPDTEVQTPAAETPEAPAAAPEAKTGPARGKQTDAQRVAAAAAKLEEMQSKNKPVDHAKTPAAEPEAPAAEATPAEPPAATEEGEKPLSEQEPTNANYRIWRNRTKKLERDEQAFKQRLTRIADVEKQFETWQAEKKLLREDPRAFWAKQAKEHGSDFTKEYEKLANAYMDEGKPDAKLDAALKRIDELEGSIADRDKKADERQRAEQERAMIGDFLRVAVADEHRHTAFTFRRHGEETVLRDAAAVTEMLINDFAKKHGRAPTMAEMPTKAQLAHALDIQYAAYYKEIGDGLLGPSQPSQGVTERVNGAEKSAKPAAPQAPKTLTNGGSAERATPPRKLTEKERIDAATKLLPG